MNTKEIEKILDEYSRKYGELPKILMFQCSGYGDPQYIAMLKNALENGTPVTAEDYKTYFPQKDDVLY